jgi:hypothetical protein
MKQNTSANETFLQNVGLINPLDNLLFWDRFNIAF